MEENEENKDLANETKEDRFKRLAEQRVAGTLDKIRLIGNLVLRYYLFYGFAVPYR